MPILIALYALLLTVALINLIFIRRPKGSDRPCFEVMIPARNEAHNLHRLLPPLIAQGVRVTVFDDESTDGTGALAAEFGARVVLPTEPLPTGWTGKNRACHELSKLAEHDWVVFLDADTEPSESFAEVLSAELMATPSTVNCASGFLRMLPGKGIEPLYLGWVPWVLLATNPFGIVRLTSKGHNGFTNGQFTVWRSQLLKELKPYETLRGEVLEDIKIGRLLGKMKQPVSVLDVSQILSVRMYEDVGQAFAGMSKNSGQIANSTLGSIFLAAFFLFVGFGWVLAGPLAGWLYAALVLSKFATDRVVRFPVYTAPFIPLTCLGAAVTVLRSTWLRRQGQITWKGRIYP